MILNIELICNEGEHTGDGYAREFEGKRKKIKGKVEPDVQEGLAPH